jgi:predicted Zn-dependent protease
MLQRLFLFCVINLFSFCAILAQDVLPKLSEAEQKEQKVIDRFWSLLEKSPRRGTSLDRVYGYYVDTGRTEELLKRCRQLTEQSPDHAGSWLLLGLVLSRRNDEDATVEALKKAVSLDSADSLAPFYLGETYIAQGQLRDAAETLEIALQRSLETAKKESDTNINTDTNRNTNTNTNTKTSSRDVLAILQTLGRVYERFGDQENSAKIWNKLEELFPGDRDILIRIAETLEEEGKFDEALKRYKKLAELTKDDHFARVQFTLAAADIKIRLGDKQGAINDFEKLLEELSGNNWLAQSIRDRVERIFVRQADYAGLAGYYQKRLQKHPNDLDTVRRLAAALVRLSRMEEAQKLLADTLEKAPSDIPLRLALIDLLVVNKDFDAVDRHYARINETEPNHPDHISQWGLALLENTRLSEAERKAAAVKIWNRLLTAKPNDPATIIMVADLMNSAKIPDEAEKLYKKAMELRPADPGYKEYLGYFYHHENRKEEAVATLRLIAEGERRTAGILAQLGGILKSLGYVPEAATAFQEAVELKPDDFELRMQYAELLFGNNNIGETEQVDEIEKQLSAAEKLAGNLSYEFARFLHIFTRWLHVTQRLNEVTEAFEKKVAKSLEPGESGLKLTAQDFWRLAMYQSAQGRQAAATESIEKAIALSPDTNILLEAAGDLFEKGNDQVRAAAIYEKLAQSDPQRRVDHLKRLANIQRDLGNMDKAIETARLVMATGAGNAANSRFYADMLLHVGRHADGIEALRRAVRLDPTDTVTLSALADGLFDAGEINEALEILWRVFERTEDLQSKIGTVSKMSTYYQQSQRFDQLIERLRQISKDAVSRRESAYCLAQAYVTVSDFEAARQTLEMLLLGTGGDEKKTDDTLLLSQLSRIAEQQGDFGTAIRYQEMLCDQIQSGKQASQEGERLLGLYQLSNEKDKMIEYLLRTLVDKGEFRNQIQAVDNMLAQEDYESAQKLLNRIEVKAKLKMSANWEFLYRKLMLEYWLKNDDAAQKTAAVILSLNLDRTEPSAKKRYEDEQTQKPGSPSASQQTPSRRIPYQGYSAWAFDSENSYSNYVKNTGNILQHWLETNLQLIPTLFRERLQLERHYFNRGLSVTTEPPKPLFEPSSFGDARFAASLWQLKIALRRDLDEYSAQKAKETNETNEVKETKKTQESNESNESNESKNSKKSDAEQMKPDHFMKALNELRTSLPADSPEVDVLRDRLRLEHFLRHFYQTAVQRYPNVFSETDYNHALFSIYTNPNEKETPVQILANIQNFCSMIEFQLAMKGEQDWLSSAYQHVFMQLGWELLKKYDIEKEFDNLLENAPPELREQFKDVHIVALKKFFRERMALLQKRIESFETKYALSHEQQIEMIFRYWQNELENVAKNFTMSLFNSYPHLLTIFKQLGYNADAKKLEQFVETASKQNPVIAGLIIPISLFSEQDIDDVPINFFTQFMIFEGNLGAILPNSPVFIDDTETLNQALPLLLALQNYEQNQKRLSETTIKKADREFEVFSDKIRKLKDVMVRVRKEKQHQQIPGMNINILFSPANLDQYMMTYISRKTAPVIAIFQGNSGQGIIVNSIGRGNIPRPITSLIPAKPDEKDNDKEKEKKKITREQLEQITATEKECYRLLDFYFEIMSEIEAEKELPTITVSVTSGTKKPLLPTLTGYKSYFEHGQTLSGYELNRILNGQSSSASSSYTQQAVTQTMSIAAVHGFLQGIDSVMKNAEPDKTESEHIDANLLKTEYTERFEKYLDDKAKNGTAFEKKYVEHAKNFLKMQGNTLGGTAIMVSPPIERVESEVVLKELEAEEKTALEKGVKLEPRKLFVLALLSKQKGEILRAVRYLDAVPFSGAADIRYREQLILKWFAGMTDDAEMKKRTEEAVKKLYGYPLRSDELMDLRQTLRVLGREEEADKLRDRLLATTTDLNTQYNLLNELQGQAKDKKSKQQLVQFALKTFRSPAVRNAVSSRNNDMSRHVRDRVLDILKNNGKLGEIVEQLEAQWKSSPGSIDMMTALADVYNKAGRKDDAKKLVLEIGDKIPDDASKMMVHANLLRNLGMNEESAQWMQKALAKSPERMLSNFWEYENTFQQTKQIPKLIELLKKIKPQILAAQFNNFSHYITNWYNNKEYAPAAKELLDYIWAMEGVSDVERRQQRMNFVRSLCTQTNQVAFYPMFHEVMKDAIRPDSNKTNQQNNPSSSQLFYAYTWSDSQCWSIGGTFFDLAEKKNCLNDLKTEFQTAVDQFAADTPKEQVLFKHNAQVALAVCETRLGHADAAVTIFEKVFDEMKSSTPNVVYQYSYEKIVLGMELAKLDHPKTRTLAIDLFETILKDNDPNTSHFEQVILAPLVKLYLKTDKAQQGRELALSQLRDSFKYMKLCGNTSYYQVGNRYYNIHTLQQSAVTFSQLLLENGEAFNVMLIYRKMYDGQNWVSAAKKQFNYRFNELDKISQQLGDKATAKDFIEHLEQLIPDVTEKKEEETNSLPLPLMLGHYTDLVPVTGSPFSEIDLWTFLSTSNPSTDKPKKSFTGIRLFDALKTVAQSEPERYSALKKRLELLEKETSEEPTVLLALTCCRLIDKDNDAAATNIHRLAEWTKKTGEKTVNEISLQIHFGFWNILKTIFDLPELLNKPETKSDCETLFQFCGKLLGRLTVKESSPDLRNNYPGDAVIRSFLVDVKQYAPADWLSQFKPDFDVQIIERLLLTPSGQLKNDLTTGRQRIAGQLTEVSQLQGIKPVMQTFEKTFQNGFPRMEGGNALNREQSYYLLEIFETVLRTAQKSNADPQIMFESLQKIVLPPEENKQPFFAFYNDLGGANGYFRTPAVDLVEWAIAANRVDDLKKRLTEKRAQSIPSLPLDAIEFILAMKTNNQQRVTELTPMFLDGLKRSDPVVRQLVLAITVPLVKPYEDAEINDRFDDLIGLINTAVLSPQTQQTPNRYVYYTIRNLHERFAQHAGLSQRIGWLQRYREITNKNNMDGFRFTIEDRLYHEGLKSLETGNLTDAVLILKFFAACPPDDFRYENLTDYLAKLETKLNALSESERQTILGDFDFSKVAKQSNANREEGNKTGLVALNYDFPLLPEGKTVYQNDFETKTGSEWSIDRRDTAPKRTGTFLGEFYEDDLRFRLTDLPEHQFVRIRFDLLILGGIDGLVGVPRYFGADIWGMKLNNGSKPIVTTFSNFHKDPNNQKQSFPDDYPLEFDFKPAWHDELLNDNLWGDELQKGYYFGRHGAAVENKLGYEKDAIYAIDVIVPHDSPELSIEFFTRFQDDPYGGGALSLAFGESWGLDHFRVDLVDKPLELDDIAFQKCFDALIGVDGSKSAAARWRLVAAGNAAVKRIEKWFDAAENKSHRNKLQQNNDFDRFRIDRVLQLIATPEAMALREKIKKQ